MKTIPTVHELRRQGHKVRVLHFRKFHRFNPQTGQATRFEALFKTSRKAKEEGTYLHGGTIKDAEEFFLTSKGGRTVVEIARDGKEIARGEVTCSDDERYEKTKGVMKAIAIAFAEMNKASDPYRFMRKLILPKKK